MSDQPFALRVIFPTSKPVAVSGLLSIVVSGDLLDRAQAAVDDATQAAQQVADDRTAVEAARTETQDLRGQTEALRDDAQTARMASETAQGAAETARDEALAAALPFGTEILMPEWNSVPAGWFDTGQRVQAGSGARKVISWPDPVAEITHALTGIGGLWWDVTDLDFVDGQVDEFVPRLTDRAQGAFADALNAGTRGVLRVQDNGLGVLRTEGQEYKYSSTTPPITGTLFVASTTAGIGEYGIHHTSEAFSWGSARMMFGHLLGLILVPGTVTDELRDMIRNYYHNRGAPVGFKLPPASNRWMNGRIDITSLPSNKDMSAVRELKSSFEGCLSLNVINMPDTYNVRYAPSAFSRSGITRIEAFNASSLSVGAGRFCFECEDLTDVPAGLFDNSPVTVLDRAFEGCALTQQSVDNILISLVTASQIDGVLGIDGGTNSPPSQAGLGAIDILVNERGWAIAVNT